MLLPVALIALSSAIFHVVHLMPTVPLRRRCVLHRPMGWNGRSWLHTGARTGTGTGGMVALVQIYALFEGFEVDARGVRVWVMSVVKFKFVFDAESVLIMSALNKRMRERKRERKQRERGERGHKVWKRRKGENTKSDKEWWLCTANG